MSGASRIPASIGPYRVIDVLGSGGMGTVYRVVHRRSGQVAAAKVLHSEPTGVTGLERFRNEARIHRALVHPCIAAVHEYLELDGTPCLVMEYVEGETLDERLRRCGPLPFDEAMAYFAALVDGVGYVHQRGVVHRDLKASNVKLDGRGGVKLLDFGIATGAGTPRLTSTGNVVGTLFSLSPEQLRTGRAGPRSDIWALGILLYEMLAARPPFDAMAPGLLTESILKGRYVALSQRRPGVPREVDRIVERCLRVRPEERYASCEALLTEVNAIRGAGGEGGAGVDGWRAAPAALLGQSGELVRAVGAQWRLVASGAAAVASLAFFAWAVWPAPSTAGGAGEGAGASGRVVPGTSAVVGTAPALDVTPASFGPARRPVDPEPERTPADASLRRVIIRVIQGEAAVFRDGAPIGRTPYNLEAPVGTEVSLLLVRDGCDDLPIRLRVEEGVGEYVETFKRCGPP